MTVETTPPTPSQVTPSIVESLLAKVTEALTKRVYSTSLMSTALGFPEATKALEKSGWGVTITEEQEAGLLWWRFTVSAPGLDAMA